MTPWKRALTRAGVIEGVSLNDDFTNRASDVPAVLAARRPAWIGLQEAKRNDYAALVNEAFGARYAVVQRMTSDATRGVALVIDTEQLDLIGKAVDDPGRLGHGYQQLTAAGNGILARGVAWQDVAVKVGGRRRVVRLATTHRHPRRASQSWNAFDEALDEWMAASPIPVWLVMDGNTHRPRTIRVRGRKRFRGIDGHIITGALRYVLAAARRLRWRTSDHRGVAALVRIPRPANQKWESAA